MGIPSALSLTKANETVSRTPQDAAMQEVLLYNELAYLWPVISPPEDYAEEAAHWQRAIRERLGSGRHRLLELGVGGGHNLSHLTAEFDAAAVDISPRMLELSRRLNPSVEHHLGDMRDVRLGQVFDAVLIHDAICYMQTKEDLCAVFTTARAHLRPGGLLLVAPDLVRDSFRPGMKLTWSTQKDGVEVRTEEVVHDADPSDTMVESHFTYTITERGSQRVEHDIHVTGLFPIAAWFSLMEEAGFATERIPLPGNGDGCGEQLFSGVLVR
jgi:SAM-dependent methyltransferase